MAVRSGSYQFQSRFIWPYCFFACFSGLFCLGPTRWAWGLPSELNPFFAGYMGLAGHLCFIIALFLSTTRNEELTSSLIRMGLYRLLRPFHSPASGPDLRRSRGDHYPGPGRPRPGSGKRKPLPPTEQIYPPGCPPFYLCRQPDQFSGHGPGIQRLRSGIETNFLL
jgi:hypothetical protein